MRAVRGEKIVPGQTPVIEPVVMGISSISRTAVRRVHQESPAAARAYFAGKISKFLLMGGRPAATASTYSTSVDRYIEWDGGGAEAEIDLKAVVAFSPDDRIRAIAHVVLETGEEVREARVLLWDDLSVSADAAEMIALPVLECVDSECGNGTTVAVDVWQLARGEKHRVERDRALARRSDVEGFLADL